MDSLEGIESGSLLVERQLPDSSSIKVVAAAGGAIRGVVEAQGRRRELRIEGIPIHVKARDLPKAQQLLGGMRVEVVGDTIHFWGRLLGGFPPLYLNSEELDGYDDIDLIRQFIDAGGLVLNSAVDLGRRAGRGVHFVFSEPDAEAARRTVGALCGKEMISYTSEELGQAEFDFCRELFLGVAQKIPGVGEVCVALEKIADAAKIRELHTLVSVQLKGQVEQALVELETGDLSAGRKASFLEAVRRLEAFQLTAGDIKSNPDVRAALGPLVEQSHRAIEIARKKVKKEENFQACISGAKTGVALLTDVLALKDPKMARRVSVVGKASISIAEAANELFKIGASWTLRAAVEPVGAILQAGMALIGLIFEKDQPDGLAIISEQIEDLRKITCQLRQEMHQRFDCVEQMLGQVYQEMIGEFVKVELKLDQLRERVERFAASTTQGIVRVTHTISTGHARLATFDLKKAIEDAKTMRRETGISEADYKGVRRVFIRWAREFAGDPLVTAAPSATPDGSAAEVQAILCRSAPWHINYLAALYLRRRVDSYVNVLLWSQAADEYMNHRLFWDKKTRPGLVVGRIFGPTHTERWLGPEEPQLIREMVTKGEGLRALLDRLSKDRDFFLGLIEGYERALNHLLTADIQKIPVATDPVVQEMEKYRLLLRHFCELGLSSSWRADPLFRLFLIDEGSSPYVLLSKRALSRNVESLRAAITVGHQAIGFFRELLLGKIDAVVAGRARESDGLLEYTLDKLRAFGRCYYPREQSFRLEARRQALLPKIVKADELQADNPHHLARLGSLKKLQGLVERNPACVHLRDSMGRTVMHYIAECGHCEAAVYLHSIGADPHVQDVDGNTPLHFAARGQACNMADTLAGLGCISVPLNDRGEKPEDLAGPLSAAFAAGAAHATAAWRQPGKRQYQVGGLGNISYGAHLSTSSLVTPARVVLTESGESWARGGSKVGVCYLNYVISQEGGNSLQVRDARTGAPVPHSLPALPYALKDLHVVGNYMASTCLRMDTTYDAAGKMRRTFYRKISVFQLSTNPREWKLVYQTDFNGRGNAQGFLCQGGVVAISRCPLPLGSLTPISSISFVDLATKQTIHTCGGIKGFPRVVHSYKGRVLWCVSSIPQVGRHPPGNIRIENFSTKQTISQAGSGYCQEKISGYGYGPHAVLPTCQGEQHVVKRVNLQDGLVVDMPFGPRNGGRNTLALGGCNNIVAIGLGRLKGEGSGQIEAIKVYDITTGELLSTTNGINLGHNGRYDVRVTPHQVLAIAGLFGPCVAYRYSHTNPSTATAYPAKPSETGGGAAAAAEVHGGGAAAAATTTTTTSGGGGAAAAAAPEPYGWWEALGDAPWL